MDECIMSTGNGKIYIHRDIPGDHGGCDCWCDPIEIPEDFDPCELFKKLDEARKGKRFEKIERQASQ